MTAEERKLVSILFADVTGSTALGETLDPEDVRALMGCYYAHARQVVTQHGGTIEKFIGDAVMAVFGLPQAHGDDAERALAAAMALRDAVARDEILGEAFQLRIGVNTGEVIATNDSSSSDFLVTGDAVNVSARLQQSAAPGEIMAGERTATAARNAFAFEESRLIEVKGKRQPLRVFPLKGKQQVRKTERPPLVGRKQDLLQLALLQSRALEEQRPQLVSIVAPAGTGKTRLLEEFLKRLDPDDGFLTATVRCLPYGQTLTYWPMRGLLQGLLDSAEITRPAIVQVFMQGGYKTDDATRLADLILTTLGIEGESMATQDRESIFTAWRLLIESFAKQAPRILVFEDLHWASDSLLDMVEHIISLRTQAPLMLIALSRPELLDRRPTWGGGRQNFTSLALQPLTVAQTQDLMKRLTAEMPEAVRAQIVERSGGNPFFALELLRGLQDRNARGEITTLDMLPDTVHAAVLARMDLLTKQERTVLQAASVASRAISAALLHAVLDNYSQHEIELALDDLLARDMLVPAEGETLAFRHILIRDVAYGTLSRAERIRLHSKLAAWLEQSAGERLDVFAELIAYHYREAVLLARQSAVPRAMPTETERAIHYLKRAAAATSRAGALTEARDYLNNAIALAPASEHLALYELLGDSLHWSGTSAQAYLKAIELWRQNYEIAQTSTALHITGARLIRKFLIVCNRGMIANASSYEEQKILLTEALQLAEYSGNEDIQQQLRVAAVFLQKHHDKLTSIDVEKCRIDALNAAEYFEQQQNWKDFSESLDAYAAVSLAIGAFDDAEHAIKRRLQVAELPIEERVDAMGMLFQLHFQQADYVTSLAIVKDGLAQRRPDESLIPFAGVIGSALAVAFLHGLWPEMPTLAVSLQELLEQVHHDPTIAEIAFSGYIPLFCVAIAREDRTATNAFYATLQHRTVDWTPERVEGYRRWLNGYLTDEVYVALDFTNLNAGDLAFQALFWNEHNTAMPAYQIELMLNVTDFDFVTRIAHIAQAIADDDNAQLARAIDEAEEHGLIPYAARMRVVLAQRTGDHSQLERARSVLECLQDCQYLKKLEEVATSLVS